MKTLELYYEVPAAPKIVGGENCFEALAEELRSLGSSTVLLITDKAADASGMADKMRLALTAAAIRSGANYVAQDAVATYAAVYELRDLFRINNCDGIAVCGMSGAINTAKALRMLLSSQEADLDSIAGVNVARKKVSIPFAVVPVGIDTSIAVTKSAYLKKESGEGREFRSVSGGADICAIDAETGVEGGFAATVLGATQVLCDSLEAFVSVNARKLTKCMNLFALRAIRDSLGRALVDPTDIAARWQLRQAGLLSGLAYDVAGAGLARAISNALAVHCGGGREAYAGIVLPEVLKFNEEKCKADYAEALYYLIGDDGYATTEPEKRAGKLVSTVAETVLGLMRQAELPATLGERGLKEEDIPVVARAAMGGYSLMTDPARATEDDIVGILRSKL